MKPTGVERSLLPAGLGGRPAPETVRQVFAVLDLAIGRGFSATGAIQALSETIPGVGALHVDAARGKLLVLYDGSVAAIKQLDQALRTLGAKGKSGSASRPAGSLARGPVGVVHQNDRPMPSSADKPGIAIKCARSISGEIRKAEKRMAAV